MPTVEHNGIAFDFLPDGDLDEARLIDRAEFMETEGDYFDGEPSRDEILDYARYRTADAAWRKADVRCDVDEYGSRGVSRSDFYFSTGWVR